MIGRQELHEARFRDQVAIARELRLLGWIQLPGRAASVGDARAWARRLLAAEVAEELADDAVLLLSELITNSIVHSDSGRNPDGLVTVVLATGGGIAHCEVIDDGSATSVPVVRDLSEEDAGGRGLWMVNAMADAWGFHHDDEVGNVVWFRIGGSPATAHAVSSVDATTS
ncbi:MULTISPECIES: ATP-binding protein [Microbispora]|uniref:ATP-binding protein n=3 Tax=Microbispora TaxID=2005 RepID=A0ABY3LSP4_9ACTN|nr:MULTISPECIES: ATP-binding protein [Microbispora]KAA9375986.1 ATP-binding protein [Microbispora cellulosiformans]TLP57876.1 ATP-binding protein [Microbispora fusca]TYB52344.1 ATP-binding protein [Microbispora tritici]